MPVVATSKAKPAEPEDQEEKPAQPTITQEQLDAIEVGDVVFHKAFGYGDVLEISDSYIIIDFHEGKKKPSRKFMFPQTFYQGLLQIG